MSSTRTFSYASFLLFLYCLPAKPQATAVAQISGIVSDPNGASVPAAQVKATQTATGQNRTATTGADGSYVLNSLPVGPYELEISVQGFKTYSRKGIVLQVNSNPEINVRLEIGSLSQQVEVTANASMAETQSNAVSQVIDQRRVVDLPLNGRQPTQLVLLSGAAVTAPPSDLASSKNYPSSTTISVAGGQANGTYYLLDGGDHNDGFGAINLPLPFPDVLQEFSVETNAIPASNGVRAGAVVNTVTKSGSNELHGNLFEFLRNGATNARNFFAAAPDPLKRNQFGGTLGGPLVRNRLFVFGGYQGTRIITAPPTSTVFEPTQAALNGDFSTLDSAACGTQRTLTDPQTHQPFPGNQIPVSRFSPQSLKFLQYVPVSSNACGKSLIAIPNNSDEDQVLTRGDWIHSDRHSVFGRYFFTDLRNPGVYDGKNLLLTTRAGVLDRVQALVLGDTYSISPSAINSVHVTWSRDHVTRGPAGNLPTSADLGISVAPSPGNFPQFVVSSKFSTFCGTCSLAHINSASKQFADDVTLIRGRHQLMFGGEWIRRSLNYQVSTQQNPEFDFNGQATNDPLADLLLGLPSTFIQGNITRVNMLQNYFALYVQDKFRVNTRVSVNFGLRWEPYFPEREQDGRVSHFDLQAYVAGQHTSVFQNAPPGLTFAGDPGFPAGGTNRHLANFAPRLGLVWDLNGSGKTVVRSAYGILYDLPPMQYFDRFGFEPPWASTLTITSPAGGLANPFLGYPGGNPFPQPSPPPKSANFVVGGQYVNLPANIHPTYMQQWNFSVQQQVGSDWLFTANYLGNKSTHQWVTQQADPAVYVPGICGSQPCSTLANEPTRRILTRINSQAGAAFSSLVQVDDGASASYNGLLLSANHRLSRNFSVLANYTWSHCINNGDVQSEITGGYQNPDDRNADRGNCYIDVHRIFNTSFVATSPRFQNRTEQTVLGDWELSTIITKRSGFWFSPTSGKDNSLTGVNADRPVAVGDSHVPDPSLSAWFNTNAFVANGAGQFGNAGRNSLQGPGAFNMDLALMRYFGLGESRRLQVRAEAFNVLNHATFNNPRASLTDANFGRVLSANDPRIFQFAMKLTF
ncbi:MAG: hypothetical protein JWO80_6042 [Bryobacterales bacterium]|nr:hypothetical protein [Bryobacterales bacterium]